MDECVPQSQLVFYLLYRAIITGARCAHTDFGLNTKLSACAHALYQPAYAMMILILHLEEIGVDYVDRVSSMVSSI